LRNSDSISKIFACRNPQRIARHAWRKGMRKCLSEQFGIDVSCQNPIFSCTSHSKIKLTFLRITVYPFIETAFQLWYCLLLGYLRI